MPVFYYTTLSNVHSMHNNKEYLKERKTCKESIHNFAVFVFLYIYNCLVAHLYHFLTVYIGLGMGVVALDTDFFGTKILQVGVFPPLPENFFCLSVLEKLHSVFPMHFLAAYMNPFSAS